MHLHDVIDYALDFYVGVLPAQLCHGFFYVVRHFNFISAFGAVHFQRNGGFAIYQCYRALLGSGVAHFSHVAQAHAGAVGQRYLHGSKRLRILCR